MPVNASDALADCGIDLDDGDVLTDVIIVGRVLRLDGPASVLVGISPGTDRVVQVGLVTAATRIIDTGWESGEE